MKPIKAIQEFLKLESASGILLGIAAILALICENSALQPLYSSFLTTHLSVEVGDFGINKPLLLWINDGFMAIFFLLVALEIKREMMEGQLSNRQQVVLPLLAAIGGIIAPALIYVFFNHDSPETLKGWAIPCATDIAFALGILMLLGNRVSEDLKICLMAIAIMDDLAAIVIIALFYTESLSLISMGIGIIAILGLFLLNFRGVTKITPYILIGILLWVCVLKSGVHATLAGVVLGFFIPLKTKTEQKPLVELEHDLHPWVAYGILPLFAFANAGVSFEGISWEVLMHPVTIGIALGLFFGKQIGIMLITGLGCLIKICAIPANVTWRQYYGMACVTGVGFTMSLFIGTLAFSGYELQSAVRMGVLLGSITSGLLGYAILRFGVPRLQENIKVADN